MTELVYERHEGVDIDSDTVDITTLYIDIIKN
jgi:hypothetical protein